LLLWVFVFIGGVDGSWLGSRGAPKKQIELASAYRAFAKARITGYGAGR